MGVTVLSNYYLYLINISWPALGWLFLILILFGGRCFQLIKKMCSDKNNSICITSALRVVLLIVVVAVYTNMFIQSNSDWFHKPMVSRGVIVSIEKDADRSAYELGLIIGEEKVTVTIDPTAARQLQTNDLVEITYLPQKKETVQCTLLTRQAQNGI